MTDCLSPHDSRPAAAGEHDRMLAVPLVGRHAELRAVSSLLADAAARLVTLRGPGGVGKSRLALEALDRATAPVVSANLADVDEDEALGAALLTVLDIPSSPASRSWPDLVAEALGEREVLLFVDNCERVVTPLAAAVPTLLARCPGLRLLITSRTRLRVHGEEVVDLAGLPLPPAGSAGPETLGNIESVRLFVQRAGAARPGFELTPDNVAAVAAVCRLVEGMPLALEIAAARTRLFEPQLLEGHLLVSLDTLCGRPGDTASRFTCVHDCLAASIDSLTCEEREAFWQLAVFPADFDLEAAEAVLEIPGSRLPVLLESLVEASLLSVRPSLVPGALSNRFSMSRTTRLSALRLLEAEVRSALLARHACHYRALVARCTGQGRRLCPDALREEQVNFEAALKHLVEGGQLDQAAEMAITLSWYWLTTDAPQRGAGYMEELLSDLAQDFRERILQGGRHLARLPGGPRAAGEQRGSRGAGSTDGHGQVPGHGNATLRSLTRREAEVATLVAQGLTNRAISRTLGIAEWTAVNHVRNIMRKLNCTSRVSIASTVSLGEARQSGPAGVPSGHRTAGEDS